MCMCICIYRYVHVQIGTKTWYSHEVQQTQHQHHGRRTGNQQHQLQSGKALLGKQFSVGTGTPLPPQKNNSNEHGGASTATDNTFARCDKPNTFFVGLPKDFTGCYLSGPAEKEGFGLVSTLIPSSLIPAVSALLAFRSLPSHF